VTKNKRRHAQGLVTLLGKRIDQAATQGLLPGLTGVPTKRQVAALIRKPCYITDDLSVEVQWDDDGLVRTVIISHPLSNGFDQHVRALGLGVVGTSSRSDVWSVIGAPSSSNHPSSSVFWDQYDGDRACIHLQYEAARMSISRVTIMEAAAAPLVQDTLRS
jgi:hypothetical protein